MPNDASDPAPAQDGAQDGAQDRALFDITGTDAHSFLQNLVTNDLDGLSTGAVYAALLTPQGKYLADFLLIAPANGLGDTIVLDVAAALAPGLIQRLGMYKLRADVAIAPSALTLSRGVGDAPAGALADPRHPALGWRLYTPGDQTGPDIGPDFGPDTAPAPAPTAPPVDWDAIRVAHCIPETGVELTPETFILEAGFERLNGVDFRKGCYVGQEVTARMKHKTQLRKGLVRVDVAGSAPIGTDILTQDGKIAGALFTQSGGQAIAYLRHDRAKGPLTAASARVSVPQ